MKVKVELQCECGNVGEYQAEYKAHKPHLFSYIDLTSAMCSDGFQAKPTPSGTWISCNHCGKGYRMV